MKINTSFRVTAGLLMALVGVVLDRIFCRPAQKCNGDMSISEYSLLIEFGLLLATFSGAYAFWKKYHRSAEVSFSRRMAFIGLIIFGIIVALTMAYLLVIASGVGKYE